MRRHFPGLRPALLAGIAVALSAVVSHADPVRGDAEASGFQASMDAAMARMDAAMRAPATGDPDRDFALMMIPHHQGAIDMAEAELRFGHDSVLRRLAQGIIVEQQQEITVMRQVLVALPPVQPAHQH